MRHQIGRGLGLVGLALLLGVAGVATVGAQDPRDALVARAFNEFDAARRQQLLVSALNPTAGPPRGAWPVGVQLLAQTLIEDGKESIAATWLRWAVRLSPDLQPDTVQFLPRVIAAYRQARDFVNQTRSRADSAVSATWLWPTQGTADTVGRIQVATTAAVPVLVEVKGVGPIGVGGSIPVSPGSYQITAAASGYDTMRVTREVIPGVTTVLEFHFPAPLARVAPPPLPPRQAPPPGAVAPKKKGFPWMWAAIGVAGAGAAVALLAGGGSKGPPPPPPTGTITYTCCP